MAKKKVKDEYPFPGSLFTKSELSYIEFAVKKIKYKVNYDNAIIEVPASEYDQAIQNLDVMHLHEKFGFQVQSYIDMPGEIFREVFDPKISTRQKSHIKVIEEVKEPALTRGQKFRTGTPEKTIEIFNMNDLNLIMCYPGTMEKSFIISKISAEIMIKDKIWKRLIC